MSIWLAIDTETTGLDFEHDQVIEVAAVVWDSRKKKIIHAMSSLVSHREPTLITLEIEGITDIDQELFGNGAVSLAKISTYIFSMFDKYRCSHFVAHNAPFDKQMLFENLCRFLSYKDIDALPDSYNTNGVEWLLDQVKTMPWIDTMTDIPYPKEPRSKHLTYLAADHGILTQYAHRALPDVMTMLKVVSLYDPVEMERLASIPNIMIRADVSYATHKKAKDRNFRWNPDKKIWFKTIKEDKIPEEKGFGFDIYKVNPDANNT